MIFCAVRLNPFIIGPSYVRNLWRTFGLTVGDPQQKEGMVIQRPDYFVFQVSLIGMTHEQVLRLAAEVRQCKIVHIQVLAAYTARKIEERGIKNQNDGDDKKRVNITGGAFDGTEIREAAKWLNSIGLGKFGYRTDGPLLRATEGSRLTHMPLQPGSTYAHLAKGIEDAYFLSRRRGDVDQELDIGSHDPEKPKIGNHWARRKADQVARDTRKETDTDEETIDETFGWNQREAERKQQVHYSGSEDLLKLARVTLML